MQYHYWPVQSLGIWNQLVVMERASPPHSTPDRQWYRHQQRLIQCDRLCWYLHQRQIITRTDVDVSFIAAGWYVSAPQFESPRCIRICARITHKYTQNTRMVHRYIIKGFELYWYLKIRSYNNGPRGIVLGHISSGRLRPWNDFIGGL